MAEFGAHLTATSDSNQPSIFEVLAQESLMSSLRPAIRHVVRIIAESNPDKLGWLYAYNDETYTALDVIIQSYYLKQYGASFSENFYGMKRTSCDATKKNIQKLSAKERNMSLLCLAIVPYLKMKLDHAFERLRQQVADGLHTAKDFKSKLYRLFVSIYPYIHLIWEGTILWYNMMYAFKKLQWHNPLLRIAGVQLNILTDEDFERLEKPYPSLEDVSWSKWLLIMSGRALGGVALTLSTGLSVGMFFIQFVEWWYSTDRATTTAVTSLPTPPPPQKLTQGILPKMSSICPLCNKVRTNDTVLSVTGFVFCYPCIYKYVKNNGRCPITAYPVKTEHLVKLYPPDR